MMQTEPLPADEFTFEHTYMRVTAQRKHLEVKEQESSASEGSEDFSPKSPGQCVESYSGSKPVVDLIVGDPDVVYPLASVTKAIAAYSVLIAVEEGKISLDDPVGPSGSTIRHLLAHTSGLPFGQGAAIAKPGTRRIYSNSGFDLLGQAVESRLGIPICEWIMQSLAQPLGMDTFRLVPSAWTIGRGSETGDQGCVTRVSTQASIAADGVASADSLARFLMELLQPALISQELFQQAITPQFDGLPGILPGYGAQTNNQWGLGFSIRADKDPHWLGGSFSPRTFGHFGQSGSFIWVDPEMRCAGLFLGAQAYSAEHRRIWPELTNQMRVLVTVGDSYAINP